MKRIIYLVALLEGFSTLAVQIIALRMATPLVGSSIILTSIYLGIILCALSVGYYVGGWITTKVSKHKLVKVLGIYLLISALWYLLISFGQAIPLLSWMLEAVDNYVITLFLTAIILFFMPVFLASQTLPLLTELLPVASKGASAGIILFASTIGSFLGSVLTSTVLFERIGVQATGIVVIVGLFVAVALLWLPHHRWWSLVVLIGGVGIALFGSRVFPAPSAYLTYKFDSAYQTIEILEGYARGGPIRLFQMNGAASSGINPETMKSPFQYIRNFVALTEQYRPKHILVIGAAGFVYPYEVAQLPYVERIDTIDIDPHVKTIAEEHFLFESLSPKIVFYPESARWFINKAIQQNIHYDLIVLDAYNDKSIPDELTTVEFFKSIQQLLAPEGKLAANFILDSDLTSTFAKNLLTSFAHVFDEAYAKNVSAGPDNKYDNFLVSNEKLDEHYLLTQPAGTLYTDNLRSTEIDIVAMFRGK